MKTGNFRQSVRFVRRNFFAVAARVDHAWLLWTEIRSKFALLHAACTLHLLARLTTQYFFSLSTTMRLLF